MLPEIMSCMLKDDPCINVDIRVDSGRKILDDLKNGKIECAFVEGSFNREELKYHKFTTEEYILVSNKKFEQISVDDLLKETLITREEGSACYELLSNELSKHGRSIHDFSRRLYANNVSLIKQLLLRGSGIGLVYKNSVQAELEQGLLYEIPIDMDFFQEFHFVLLQNNMFAHDYLDFYNYAWDIYNKKRALAKKAIDK